MNNQTSMPDFVLTLISAPGAAALSSAVIEGASSSLGAPPPPSWLAEGKACDIFFVLQDPERLSEIEAELREMLSDEPIDMALQAVARRRKKLLIADMDSTIICEECIDEIARAAGLGDDISAITERAMCGEIAFDAALTERVALFEGLDETLLDEVRKNALHLTKGARTLVQTMRAHGAYCALVSGGFKHFTGPIAKAAGFHTDRSNELEVKDGRLTGKVRLPILGAGAKRDALNLYCRDNKIDCRDALSIGDGANDLEMIEAAGLGIAFHGKPIVAMRAKVRIDHGDLTAVLYVQGYKAREFIAY